MYDPPLMKSSLATNIADINLTKTKTYDAPFMKTLISQSTCFRIQNPNSSLNQNNLNQMKASMAELSIRFRRLWNYQSPAEFLFFFSTL